MKKIRLVNFHFHVLHNVPFMSFMISRKMFNKMCNTLIPAEQYFSSSSPKKWRQMSRFNTHLPQSIIIYISIRNFMKFQAPRKVHSTVISERLLNIISTLERVRDCVNGEKDCISNFLRWGAVSQNKEDSFEPIEMRGALR